MSSIKTWSQEQVTIDFHQDVYETIRNQYQDVNDFSKDLKRFIAVLIKNKDLYNINPYSDGVKKGIHILGKDEFELGIFPNPELAIKCSQGKPFTENLRKQFYRTVELAEDFETKLTGQQRRLLQICPVYFHVQDAKPNSFFKQLLFMKRVSQGINLGQSNTGFDTEFRQAFDIPSLEEIRHKHQFNLHRQVDKDKKRQLLKIQTTYLFRRLLDKDIKICSLNQKNVLVDKIPETGQTRYIIIDSTEDLFPPLSPMYNILTHQLCK